MIMSPLRKPAQLKSIESPISNDYYSTLPRTRPKLSSIQDVNSAVSRRSQLFMRENSEVSSNLIRYIKPNFSLRKSSKWRQIDSQLSYSNPKKVSIWNRKDITPIMAQRAIVSKSIDIDAQMLENISELDLPNQPLQSEELRLRF